MSGLMTMIRESILENLTVEASDLEGFLFLEPLEAHLTAKIRD